MSRTSPIEFIKEVNAEAKKVTWPSRKETLITATMVVIMAILAAVFFLLADDVFSWATAYISGVHN